MTLSGYKYAVEIVYRHAETSDGFAAFIDLITKYNGSTRIRCFKLWNVLNKPYTSAYPGGLQTYIIDFEQAYVEQDQLEYSLAQDEQQAPRVDLETQRRECLINCLYAEPTMRQVVFTSVIRSLIWQETSVMA